MNITYNINIEHPDYLIERVMRFEWTWAQQHDTTDHWLKLLSYIEGAQSALTFAFNPDDIRETLDDLQLLWSIAHRRWLTSFETDLEAA